MVLDPLGVDENVLRIIGHGWAPPGGGSLKGWKVGRVTGESNSTRSEGCRPAGRGYVRNVEHAPLRPLPSRSSRRADPKLARRYVGARLPGLDEEAVRALALVELAHVGRDQAR